MAEELQIAATVVLNNTDTGVSETLTINNTLDQFGEEVVGGTKTIGTSTHVALPIGDVTLLPCKLWISNLEPRADTPEAYILYGIDDGGTFHAIGELHPGNEDLLTVTTTAIYVQAVNSDVKIKYLLIEGVD